MRILHLGYTHVDNPWNAGGAAVAAREVYARLAERHDVTIFCGGWAGCLGSVDVGKVRYVFGPPVGSYVLSRLSYSRRARQMAARDDYDLIVDDMSAYSPSFAWRVAKCPTIALIQLDLIRATHKYPVIGTLARRWVLEALRTYREFICVSPALMADTQPLTPANRRAVFIPNGVSADLLTLERREEPFVLFLGRLDIYAKGLDVLLREFAQFAARNSNVRLVIAGNGPDEAKLKAQVQASGELRGKVEFVGRVGGEAKTDLLRKCLCVVMPSRHEGWPLVAMEAGACGKAVVGSLARGLSDAVVDGETGFLADNDQPGALAEALVQVVSDHQLRARLSQAAATRAAEFTWDAIAPRYEAFYSSVGSA